jgi:hypothetical protein
MVRSFPPTELDLALAEDPIAEAARIALYIAAGELPGPPVPVEGAPKRGRIKEQKATKQPKSE